jgi:Spy/CpxP family protein refolding chaperone
MKRLAALATVLVLSLGLSAGGFANQRKEGYEKGMEYPHHARASMFHSRAFDRLRDELKLDASQEALWKEARDFVRGQRDAMRERFRKERAEIGTLLGQPDADLRVVAKRMDEMRSERLKQHDAVRERWFTVYDSLDAGQKEKVRLFFKSGMERMGESFRGRRDHSRRGPRHHPDVSAPAR